MYITCYRFLLLPHMILIRLVKFGHTSNVNNDTHWNIYVKIFFRCWSGHYRVVGLFALSFSFSSTSLIASATVTAALLILSSTTLFLFSLGEGRASSPRLKRPKNPNTVAIRFILNIGKSPGLKSADNWVRRSLFRFYIQNCFAMHVITLRKKKRCILARKIGVVAILELFYGRINLSGLFHNLQQK